MSNKVTTVKPGEQNSFPIPAQVPPTESLKPGENLSPPVVASPTPRKRKPVPVSSGIQTLAKIERLLKQLPPKTQKMIVAWFKEYEPEEQANASPTG